MLWVRLLISLSASKLDLSKFKYSLNSVLPKDISITNIEAVDEDFHSRFSAKKRSYIYLISSQKSPFFERYSYTYYSELKPEKLNELSSTLIGDKGLYFVQQN